MRFNSAIHLFDYPLDETVTINASDRLPFSFDGTYLPNDGQFPTRHELSSEPVLGSDGQPLPGGTRAAKFLRRESGLDDASVLIPDIGDFIDVGSGQFTVSFWARSTSDSTNLPGRIVQIRDSAGGVFMLDGNFSNLRGQRGRIAPGDTEPTYDQFIRTNRTEGPYLINSKWHHYIVAVTGDASTAGSNNMEFYVDGDNYRTAGPSGSQEILAAPGVHLAWSSGSMDAFFARFRIYRGAITSAEASLLYQQETVGTLVETGRIAGLVAQRLAADLSVLSRPGDEMAVSPASRTAIADAVGSLQSSPNYPRTTTTIRPPLRILNAAGEPVLGLAHDAPGLAIEWRRVGGPATWTTAPQTAAGWTEAGAGFYDATINVGDQADQTVAVRWTHNGVTSLPRLVSFTGFTGETGGTGAGGDGYDPGDKNWINQGNATGV